MKPKEQLQRACVCRAEEHLATLKEDMDSMQLVYLSGDELVFIKNALIIHGSNPKFPGRRAPTELLNKIKAAADDAEAQAQANEVDTDDEVEAQALRALRRPGYPTGKVRKLGDRFYTKP
jgi:hypothetical protein